MVIAAMVLLHQLSITYTTTNAERDRVFAYSKAQAILSEIQNHVNRRSIEAVELDSLDDGTTNKPSLSIQTDGTGTLVTPDHAISGNFQRGGHWVWSRRVTVQPFLGVDNRNVRYVTVRIYRRDAKGVERPLADLSAVVNSGGQAWPATQVHDLYLLAIENIPGWWVFMDSIRPFMESMITDLETRNPGLELRTHWITKASFGRNPLYRPYTNSTADSTAAIPDVYAYPGRMPTGSASAFYYVPDNIKARINVDGLEANGHHDDRNPYPYALADYFNHAMRYPDELALWQLRVDAIEEREQEIAAAKLAGTAPPEELDDMSKEPTLRLFLEDLYSDPAKYRNAMIVNLHGELLPMPALRNYSDAAKSQVAHPNVRVVTHPEELRTKKNDAVDGSTDALQFRVYSYAYQTSATTYPAATMTDPIVLDFVGVDLTDRTTPDPTRLSAGVSLTNVRGGTLVAGTTNYSGWWNAKNEADSPVAGEMYYRVAYGPPAGGAPGYTRLFLFRTPIGAKPVSQTGGVHGLQADTAANAERSRLYQMEYVPCPVSTVVGTPTFTPDLTSPGIGPKNTARWRIRLAPSLLTDGSFEANTAGDVVLQVRTRIASGFSGGSSAWENSGTAWPTPDDPDNLSVTYAWWANSREDVPFTERAQFNGDPRYVPYKDCFHGGDDFPNSYNWFLDNLTSGSELGINDYRCLQTAATSPATTNLRDTWGGALACDVPRYMQLLREGLLRSRCVYTSLTGWSNYYLGIGNDIGYDSANGYPSSIPVNLDPFGSPGSWGYVDMITGARRFVRGNGATNYWWGMPWLGELVPDTSIAQWLASSSGGVRGNLPSGTSAGRFYQAPSNSVYAGSTRQAWGTDLPIHNQRTHQYGGTTFFNIGTSASTFQHSSATTDGTLTAVGTEISGNYNLPVPATAPVTRPFRINANTAVAEHWNLAPYTTRCTASLFQTYYSHSAGAGSAVVKLVDPTNTNAAYVVVNGIANTVTNGTPFIAQWNLLALVHTTLAAGATSNTFRIKEQPRVEIKSPTDITELIDPTTVPVQFGIQWCRWDGLPYTATGTFAENELELEYQILYSRDGGTTWLHVQDDAPAKPGVRPDASYLVPDLGAGDETYPWDVSSGFPEGTYVLRIDCFRTGARVHYAYHQTRLFLQR